MSTIEKHDMTQGKILLPLVSFTIPLVLESVSADLQCSGLRHCGKICRRTGTGGSWNFHSYYEYCNPVDQRDVHGSQCVDELPVRSEGL